MGGQTSLADDLNAANRPPKLAALVENALIGANISREGWEAKVGRPPMGETELTLENLMELLGRQGAIVAELAVFEPTRRELRDRLRGATKRLPAFLEGRVCGTTMSPRSFLCSIAGLLALHREAIERVMDDQVERSDVVDEILAEGPIPAPDDDAGITALAGQVNTAICAHSEALLVIALDLDRRLERY